MSGLRILTMTPVLIFLAVNEFIVMCILPVLGIPDGPVKYLIDAGLLVVLSAPFLYAWAERMQSRSPWRIKGDSNSRRPETLEELERQALIEALEMAQGDRTRAALTLGASRATIYRRIKKLGLADGMRA